MVRKYDPKERVSVCGYLVVNLMRDKGSKNGGASR
jgi:hypothetical protein